jgi:hypothetical protein
MLVGMKRRKSIWIIFSCLAAAGCGGKKATIAEEPWIDMRDHWEGMGGGQIDPGEPLRIGWGEGLTAVKWQGDVPKPPFEMKLMAMRVDGTDFFCAVTFPVRESGECVTLVIGGWGGSLVGISSIDGKDASENETTSHHVFDTDVWYRIHLVCEGERIAAWIDGKKVVDVDTTGKKLSLREGQISDCAPFGLATWQTTGVIRNARWRPL